MTLTASPPFDPRALRWNMEEDGITLLPILWKHPLEWRDRPDGTGEFIDLWLPVTQRWRRVRKANWLPFLEGLAAGLPLPEVYRRGRPQLANRVDLVARFIFGRLISSLRGWGIMEFAIPEVPRQLAGRYHVQRELGRGGMGIVWLAHDEQTDAGPLVIKHAWNGAGALESRDRALRGEYASMNAFDHPSIVKALDSFEHEGRFHLVRACLDGTPLSKVDPVRRKDPAFRVRVTRQVAETVDHMIGRGYFYLDLKPSNYFVDAEDGVILSDLGMCRKFDPHTRSAKGGIATPAYAAPEIYQKAETTEPTLVYALGALHWQLVMGKAPKPKTHPDRLLERLPPDLPEWERAFLTATLRHAREERVATIRDAARLLPGGAP
ncbi:MAG TPA: serine/threonine-protein kinase [Candidatus Thermoplasmatota archaeon]|nr:serine/threonine-protein kinase [Candidatus Thermoplasmatota archaeon]